MAEDNPLYEVHDAATTTVHAVSGKALSGAELAKLRPAERTTAPDGCGAIDAATGALWWSDGGALRRIGVARPGAPADMGSVVFLASDDAFDPAWVPDTDALECTAAGEHAPALAEIERACAELP